MDYKQTLESAKEAVEQENYSEADSICKSLIDNGYDTSEVYTISAISLLNRLSYPLSVADQNTLYNYLTLAADTAKTLEDAYKIDYSFTEAYFKWVGKHSEDALETLEEYPSDSNWDACINKGALLFDPNIILYVFGNDNVRALSEKAEEGATTVLSEKYNINKLTYPINSDEYKEKVYNTGIRIFDKAKYLVNQYQHASASKLQDAYMDALMFILQHYMIAERAVGYSIPPEKDSNGKTIEYSEEENKVICQRLKTSAEIKDNLLKVVMYPDGNSLSLFGGSGRGTTVYELKGIYERIKRIDPSFEQPNLPNEEPISLKSNNSNTSSGCYVATAIYGSYDCPAVWTLRRYRDYTLASTWYGQAFIRIYYSISPTLVKWFGEKDWFRAMWKPKLDRIVRQLNEAGVSATPYQDRNW